MSNETKQTTVEWIEYQVEQQGITHYFSLREILEQAKEMEKKQMQHWFGLGMHLVEGRLWKPIDKFEENFNETYGGNK
jgi:hypothetical protein